MIFKILNKYCFDIMKQNKIYRKFSQEAAKQRTI